MSLSRPNSQQFVTQLDEGEEVHFVWDGIDVFLLEFEVGVGERFEGFKALFLADVAFRAEVEHVEDVLQFCFVVDYASIKEILAKLGTK